MSKKITLLEAKQKLFSVDSKTNVIFEFTVNKEYNNMIIEFSYSPKILEDEVLAEKYIKEAIKKYSPEEYESPDFNWRDYLTLNNLITVSADCNGEYRGCGHRQSPNQEIIISKDKSTEGFYSDVIYPGKWRIVLSVHAVIQTCDFALKVSVN